MKNGAVTNINSQSAELVHLQRGLPEGARGKLTNQCVTEHIDGAVERVAKPYAPMKPLWGETNPVYNGCSWEVHEAHDQSVHHLSRTAAGHGT